MFVWWSHVHEVDWTNSIHQTVSMHQLEFLCIAQNETWTLNLKRKQDFSIRTVSSLSSVIITRNSLSSLITNHNQLKSKLQSLSWLPPHNSWVTVVCRPNISTSDHSCGHSGGWYRIHGPCPVYTHCTTLYTLIITFLCSNHSLSYLMGEEDVRSGCEESWFQIHQIQGGYKFCHLQVHYNCWMIWLEIWKTEGEKDFCGSRNI